MNGWILYRGNVIPELKRAAEEAEKAGIKLEVVDPGEIELLLDPDHPDRVYRHGVSVPPPMFVMAAFVDDADYFNLALLQQLETQGILCINRAGTLLRTRDKLYTLQLLAERGIPVPKTILLRDGSSASRLGELLGWPLVVKVIDGSKGNGVSLIRSESELSMLLEMLSAGNIRRNFLAQEFIADSQGRDVRVLVIGHQPVVCMLRKNRHADGFKSNFSAGGQVESYPLTERIRELSTIVIEAMDLNIGGIDLLFKGNDFVVGEVNSVPGFQGIESCCDINVPVEVLKSIGRQLASRRKGGSAGPKPVGIDQWNQLKEIDLARNFMAVCGQVAEIQHEVLMDIINYGKATRFGREHDFDSIRSVEDFRRRVPVMDWTAIEDHVDEMEAGHPDILFQGATSHFIITSGTTGNSKLLPESPRGKLAKTVSSRLRNIMIIKNFPGVMDGKFLPLANRSEYGKTDSGIPIGTASGLTMMDSSPEIIQRLAYPPEILQISVPSAMDYALMRIALVHPDVTATAGNNPGRLSELFDFADAHRDALIRDIAQGTLDEGMEICDEIRDRLRESMEMQPNPERAAQLAAGVSARGSLDPRDYWPNLMLVSCWISGSIGGYLDQLKPKLPESTRFMDCGYGASEAKINIPLKPGQPEGPLTLFGYFFEFIPLSGGEPLMAHQLQDGESYRIVITSYSGLYRYDLHDIVTVKGFTGQNPNVCFVSKTRDMANIAGEKLAGSYLLDIFSRFAREQGIGWRQFGVFTDEPQHRYDFLVESEQPEFWNRERLNEFDRYLQSQAIIYSLFRNQNLIHFPRLIIMGTGWQDKLYGDRVVSGQSISQVKLPVIYSSIPHPEMIVGVVSGE